ncbi:Predicted DNA-binding transcriptional regulator YafY, contains an HTH and WYL domains [Anaerocolumna jejuensis DSM 15929]|uniref:Predicted DNA-binding transcriptional regulator YafY, contains an HTH and WYL domains n=1 Tax=Anaerocolumna jejuensis DSM 15929 TaxID=1121322 RepID=A0A1M6YKT4_9FIRM|nr:YafY family protein [Anaerocolumna jejuensis]SHL18730.1 Predicted DNA-binding transcriptional regulator YafY, contains an HTH and WYL domains [Anaerocolumna jejuensis DSM 15929]
MKIDRLIGILSILLQQEKVTSPVLAKKFEVSRRTIHRDVEDLCKAGIPIVTKQGTDGGIAIMDGYKIDRTLLTTAEMQAVLKGLQSLDSISGGNKYQTLMDKLSVNNSDILSTNNHILIDLSSWNTKSLAPKIELFQGAIEGHKLVSIRYFSPGGDSERTIEPYLLLFRWHSWYIWGYCRLREEFRLFKIGRMDEIKVLREQFEPRKVEEPVDSQMETFYQESLRITAAFDHSVKWRLMEEFDLKKLKLGEDGRIYIEFVWWDKEALFGYLLGFMDKVQIIKPEELREEFLAVVLRVAGKYKE